MKSTAVAALICLVASSAGLAAEPQSAVVDAAPAAQAAPKPAPQRAAAESPAAKPDAKKATTAAAPSASSGKSRTDRLELDTTTVTGNRELPKVLYIVPWKKADIGDLPSQPFNTLLDEVLTPVDRDVFRREVTYYDAINDAAAAAANGSAAPAAQAPGSEK